MSCGGESVKIGISNNPPSRRRFIQTGNSKPVRLTWWVWAREGDAVRVEREAHQRLRQTCTHAVGEWYFIGAETAQAFLDSLLHELGVDHWDDEMFRTEPWDWNTKLAARIAARGPTTKPNRTAGYNCRAE